LGAQKPQIIQETKPGQSPSFIPRQKSSQPVKNEKRVLETNSNEPQNPPSDWLEPKIFKGSSNI